MIEAKNILTLLGLPSEKIKSFLVQNNESHAKIYVELNDLRGYCPKCGSTEIGIKDYYKVTINNSIIKHMDIQVEINVRRYVCKKCGKTFKQDIGFYRKGSTTSNNVINQIIDDLSEKITMTQIAKDHNTSINTVDRVFDKAILPQLPLPLSEIICVDEFCFKHGDRFGKYPFVITNPVNGVIIDIVESRWKSILFEYFNKVKPSYRYAVKYFVSDMNETYRDVKRAFFRDAIHIVDRFHIIKAFNEMITAIRTRIIKQEVYELSEYRYLKKNWKIFLKDRKELEKCRKVDNYGVVTDPTVDLDRCLMKYPDLYYAYWTKEDFRRDTSKLLYYGQASETINFYINKMTKSSYEEVAKVGKMLQNWKYEIINGITSNPYSHKLSNAVAEATNNQIQTLIDLSYGLPNFDKMRKRVLYINRTQKKK